MPIIIRKARTIENHSLVRVPGGASGLLEKDTGNPKHYILVRDHMLDPQIYPEQELIILKTATEICYEALESLKENEHAD